MVICSLFVTIPQPNVKGVLQNNKSYYKIVNFDVFEINICVTDIESNRQNIIPRPDVGWDRMRYYFPRYSDALIRDIETGRVFTVRRTFGGLHADVEPLTADDTRIMYEIWGGWSWARRAVVVYIGNYAFAGSLAGMPHAGVDSAPVLAIVDNRSGGFGRGQNFDMISGNDVCGHFCLHFAGSRTHGNENINAAHQNKVRIAAAHIANTY